VIERPTEWREERRPGLSFFAPTYLGRDTAEAGEKCASGIDRACESGMTGQVGCADDAMKKAVASQKGLGIIGAFQAKKSMR
jgi:hypothetical protein